MQSENGQPSRLYRWALILVCLAGYLLVRRITRAPWAGALPVVGNRAAVVPFANLLRR